MGEPLALQAATAAEKARARGSTVAGSTGSRAQEDGEERLRKVGSRSSREGASRKKWRGAETWGLFQVLEQGVCGLPGKVLRTGDDEDLTARLERETWAVLSSSRVASTEVEALRSRSSS